MGKLVHYSCNGFIKSTPGCFLRLGIFNPVILYFYYLIGIRVESL